MIFLEQHGVCGRYNNTGVVVLFALSPSISTKAIRATAGIAAPAATRDVPEPEYALRWIATPRKGFPRDDGSESTIFWNIGELLGPLRR